MAAGRLPDGRVPVLLSAHAGDLIAGDAAAMLAHLEAHPTHTDVADVAATVHRTRRLRRHRAVVRAADRDELTAALGALADGVEHPLVTRSPGISPQQGDSPRIAFVFPGQGSQWPSMGVAAYNRLPEYRAEVDRCAAAFAAAGASSTMDYLLVDPAVGAETNDYSQVQIQGAQFVHGVALARVWRSCGVLPDITVGHSLGEIGAAYVAGSITLADAVQVVIARATVLDGLTGPYRVAVLGVTPDEALTVIAETPGWLELSVVNSQASVAVSGDAEAVATAVRVVSGRGGFAKEIEMWFPAHTTALDPVRPELESLLPTGTFAEAPVQLIGATTGDVVASGTEFGDYWYTNLRSTVRFDRAVRAAIARGAHIFIELSAHPALLFALGDLLEEAGGAAVMVGSGRRDEPIVDRLSANIATVGLADPGFRWADLHPDAATRRIPLPGFPFAPMRAEHHWARPAPLPPVPGLTVAVEHWEELTINPSVSAGRRVAVIDLGVNGRVADALRTAMARDGMVAVADSADADLLIVVAPVLDDLDVVRAADELGDQVGGGLLGYVDAITPTARDVWLVTVRAERVSESGPAPLPAQAALAAMHRSVGFEHPDQNFRHVDLPSWTPDDATAAVALTAILTATDDLVIRATGAGSMTYRRTIRDETVHDCWAVDTGLLDNVVITGGTGAVGLHFARSLIERGARRLVLLSRGGADPAQVAELAGTHDVEILAPRCDITNPARLLATAIEFGSGPASLVIHAAGAATIAPHRDLTAVTVGDTISAKVLGLDQLVRTWPIRDDARILLCSSVSGLWGGHGHAAYSAANRLLDVMAGQLRADGRRCTAVRWGLWPGGGIIDAHEITRVQRSGLQAMTPELAVEAGLRDHAGDPLVFAADPNRLRTFLGDHDDRSAEAAVESAGKTVDAVDRDAAGVVRSALAAVLKRSDMTAFDLDESLIDLGVDSLLALDLRKKITKATGQTVSLATILGGVSATGLIEQLERPVLPDKGREGARLA